MKAERDRAVVLSLAAAAVLIIAGCSSSSTPPGPSPTPMAMGSPPPAPEPEPAPAPAPQTARYQVVFESTWSEPTHPTDFPDNAHYSGLIGGTHSASVHFWREGSAASEGIRLMAERGRKSPLDTEVMQAVSSGMAQHVLSGPDLQTSPATAAMEFDISQGFSLVTLVTMVAPSPDWFVGVESLPLFANGQWVEEVRVELYPFDAGTDSGESYESPDEATVPRQPIRRLTGYPVSRNGTVAPFGTFTFRRIS
jgi:hypothetical protein